MFATEPPSSSDPKKRSCRRHQLRFGAFRRLLLQIGGANIAARIALLKPPSSSSFAEEEGLRFLFLLLLTTAAPDPVLRRLSISDSSHPNGGDHRVGQFAAVPGIVA
jgi:hypothetical protein